MRSTICIGPIYLAASELRYTDMKNGQNKWLTDESCDKQHIPESICLIEAIHKHCSVGTEFKRRLKYEIQKGRHFHFY